MPAVITAGIKAGIRTGIKTGITGGTYVDGGVAADTDATSGKYVPSSAAQFAALGLSAPVSIHLCQEAAGNLADSVGSLTLTANGSPTYQQPVSGWTRVAVGFTQAANQRFGAAAGVGPNPGTTSTLWLVYAAVVGAQGGNRDMFGPNITGSNFAKVQVTTTPRLRTNIVTGGITTGSSDPTATGLQPMLFKVDRTGGAAVLYTGQEKITGVYNAAIAESTVKGFGSSGGTSFGGLIAYSAVWSGASAEVSDAQAKSLLQALGWTIPWS